MSYGTYFGAVCTQLFPARADRIVLDSNLDPARMGNETFGPQRIGQTMYEPEEGARYLSELRDALDGKPHDLVVPQDGAGDDASTSLYWSVLCNDNSAWPRGAQPYRDQVAEMMRRYPIAGGFLTGIKPCAFWSLLHTEPDVVVDNDVPALLLQYEWDPATPDSLTAGMHRALRGSRLAMVSKAVEHGVYRGANPYVVDVVHSYLSVHAILC